MTRFLIAAVAALCLISTGAEAKKPTKYCWTAMTAGGVDWNLRCYDTRKEAAQARRAFRAGAHAGDLRDTDRARRRVLVEVFDNDGRVRLEGGVSAERAPPVRPAETGDVATLRMARASAAPQPPARFIAGPLTCARNVNAALEALGIKGTESARARDFLNWGASTEPVPGAVAVYARENNPQKGHAALVSRVEGSTVYVWNPSPRGWREVIYPRPALDYRVAS